MHNQNGPTDIKDAMPRKSWQIWTASLKATRANPRVNYIKNANNITNA